MRSRVRLLALGLGLMALLGGCRNGQEEATPSILVPSTPMPVTTTATSSIVITPAPTLRNEPVETEEIAYTLADFCPSENLYISYLLSPEEKQQESYLEFRRQREDYETLQRRYLSSGQEPYVEVVAYNAGEIVQRYRREGVGYTYDFTGRSEDERILLQEPIQLGAGWDIEDGQSEITAVGQLVTLPMGEVRVVEVSSRFENGQQERMLFMEDVGMVAHYIYDENQKLISGQEAAEYESGRKFNQMIRFFYADYANADGKIYYRSLEVPVDVNPSMGKIFRDLLQKAPSDSTLLPLSQGINIKNITLRGRSVYINFSDELGYMVDQLNLNRMVEPAFLQALVNTFGEYYQANKVYLQIEGEPYASKFRVWTEDDYLSPDLSNVERYR